LRFQVPGVQPVDVLQRQPLAELFDRGMSKAVDEHHQDLGQGPVTIADDMDVALQFVEPLEGMPVRSAERPFDLGLDRKAGGDEHEVELAVFAPGGVEVTEVHPCDVPL
jgi:hypothetical protein